MSGIVTKPGGYIPSRDIIERDSDGFVYESKDGRTGWNTAGKGHAHYLYRDEEIRGLDMEKQLMKAYRACQNRASNLTDKPFNIVFNPAEKTGSTDGKAVYITTEILNEPFDFGEKIDILLGYTTHEVAHILYTNMKEFSALEPFERTVCNVIEDERIEHRIGTEFPGYAQNLKSMKTYLFDHKYDIAKHITALSSHPMKEMAYLYDLFFKKVRYPKFIDQDVNDRFEMEIEEIMAVLNPYPDTWVKVREASKKIALLFDEKFRELSGKGSGAGAGSAGAGAEAEEAKKAISEATKAFESTGVKSVAEGMKTAANVDKIDYRGEWIEDEECQAAFRKPKAKQERYERLLAEVKADSRILARTMFIKTSSESKKLYGLRNGTMDDNRIVELANGVNNVYTSTTPKISKKINVCILIDESGSMGGSKCDDAARSAIIIEQAYKQFPMGELFIYGFTSDQGGDVNTIYRYKEPGFELKYGLGDVSGRGNNRDGDCILAVAKRVREFTNEPFIYFIISDGMPAGSGGYGGMGAVTITRKAVQKVTTMRFFPIQIGIGVREENQKLMFDHYINYENSRQMVDGVRKLLSRNANKIFGI